MNAAIRERHGDDCQCEQAIPCDSLRLLAHIDAITAKVEGLRPNAMQYTKERAGFEDALAAVLAILRGEA